MRVLITGAAGFIGTHLAKFCLDQGHDVYMIDNNWHDDHPFGGRITHLNPKHKTYDIDVADRWHNEYQGLEALFDNISPDVCYHLAAYASEGRSNHIRSFIHQNNTVGTANVINACVNSKCKLVFTSSVAVYSGSPPFSEQTTPNPLDEYGLSKYTSERSIAGAIATQELQAVVIRPRNVVGRYQNLFDPSRNLFGIWMYRALNKMPMYIYGDGSNKRSFTAVQNLIPALYKAKDSSPTDYNVGSTNIMSLNDAAELFAKVTGYSAFEYTEARHEVKEAYCMNGKAEQMLGYKDSMSLEDCLIDMWEWAKTVPMRSLDVPPPLEVEVNAHSSLK